MEMQAVSAKGDCKKEMSRDELVAGNVCLSKKKYGPPELQ
jgi:hypothetical protein